MDNPRPEKVAVVDEVRKQFDESDAAILTEYRGLKVKDLAVLRRSLRATGSEYKVYKNTLVRLATREVGLGDLDGLLQGPTGIAFVRGDAAAAAKTLRDFSRTNNLLIVKGGVLGQKVLNAADTTALADLPSRDVLLARVAGALAAPLQQFASLLQALPRNLAFGLAALRDQLAEAAPAEEQTPETTEAPPAADEAPVEAVLPVEDAAPADAIAPVEDAAPVEAVAPVEDAAPADAIAPASDEVPVDAIAPLEDAAPVDATTPTEDGPAEETPADEPAPADPTTSADDAPAAEDAPTTDVVPEGDPLAAPDATPDAVDDATANPAPAGEPPAPAAGES